MGQRRRPLWCMFANWPSGCRARTFKLAFGETLTNGLLFAPFSARPNLGMHSLSGSLVIRNLKLGLSLASRSWFMVASRQKDWIVFHGLAHTISGFKTLEAIASR